jgi:hypothetical protein
MKGVILSINTIIITIAYPWRSVDTSARKFSEADTRKCSNFPRGTITFDI